MNKHGLRLKNKAGYTLVEVTLFLALSSMLSLIAFVGLGPRLRNVRFTSGMRTINDVITKQSANLDVGFNSGSDRFSCTTSGSGANARPVIVDPATVNGSSGATGSSAACVINGKAFYFQANRLTTYYITSLTKPRQGCITPTISDLDRLMCYAPYAFNGDTKPPAAVQTNYPNGITFSRSASGGDPKTDGSQAFGYIIDPDTNVRYQFVYGLTHSDNWTNNSRDPGSWGGFQQLGKDDLALNQTKTYCFGLSGRVAGIRITPDTTVPVLSFEDSACL